MKGKTIHSEPREMINYVNHQRKQEALENGLILPANYCRGSVATVKNVKRHSRQKNYANLRLIFLTRFIYSPTTSARAAKAQARS